MQPKPEGMRDVRRKNLGNFWKGISKPYIGHVMGREEQYLNPIHDDHSTSQTPSSKSIICQQHLKPVSQMIPKQVERIARQKLTIHR